MRMRSSMPRWVRNSKAKQAKMSSGEVAGERRERSMTRVMDAREWPEDCTDLDMDCPENSAEEDDKLREYWAKKERRRSSILKEFVGDSLGLKANQRTLMHLTKFGESTVLFSDVVFKVNRKGRLQERWLMITEGGLYNIEPGSSKFRRRIAIGNISHISVSLLSDNFLVIHVPQEYDYVYISRRKTEIVAALRIAYAEAIGDELSLTMQNVIDYHIDKFQQRRLVFQRGEDGVFTNMYAKRTK